MLILIIQILFVALTRPKWKPALAPPAPLKPNANPKPAPHVPGT